MFLRRGRVLGFKNKSVVRRIWTPRWWKGRARSARRKPKVSEIGGRGGQCGEGEIRTLDSIATILVFETNAFNRSATSPIKIYSQDKRAIDTIANSIPNPILKLIFSLKINTPIVIVVNRLSTDQIVPTTDN